MCCKKAIRVSLSKREQDTRKKTGIKENETVITKKINLILRIFRTSM